MGILKNSGGGGKATKKTAPDPRAELNAAAFDGLNSGDSKAKTLDVGGSGLMAAGGDPLAGASAARGGRGFSSKKDALGGVSRMVRDTQKTSKDHTGSADKDLQQWSQALNSDGSSQKTQTNPDSSATNGRNQGTKPNPTRPSPVNPRVPGVGKVSSIPMGLIAVAIAAVALLGTLFSGSK